MSLLLRIKQWLGLGSPPAPSLNWQAAWSQCLIDNVAFYRGLSSNDRQHFHQRLILFLHTTAVEARQFHVSDKDRLLVAASAIIPVWGFPKWHYFNLKTVYLLPAAFNKDFECGQEDSVITGMVGTNAMAGKMVLSQPALHLGFKNTNDKRNVGIHEFVHLIDMADGRCDGYPECLKAYDFATPWFALVADKIRDINHKSNGIRAYGGTNNIEFLAVVSEYFFERPQLLSKKHPEVFAALSQFYRQDVLHIAEDVRISKKAPCPCGSGKRYKRCCLPQAI